MFCLWMFETSQLIGTVKPFEVFRCDDDISGMGAAGEFSTTRAVAILKYVFRTVKLIADSATETAAFEGFTHVEILMWMGFSKASV